MRTFLLMVLPLTLFTGCGLSGFKEDVDCAWFRDFNLIADNKQRTKTKDSLQILYKNKSAIRLGALMPNVDIVSVISDSMINKLFLHYADTKIYSWKPNQKLEIVLGNCSIATADGSAVIYINMKEVKFDLDGKEGMLDLSFRCFCAVDSIRDNMIVYKLFPFDFDVKVISKNGKTWVVREDCIKARVIQTISEQIQSMQSPECITDNAKTIDNLKIVDKDNIEFENGSYFNLKYNYNGGYTALKPKVHSIEFAKGKTIIYANIFEED